MLLKKGKIKTDYKTQRFFWASRTIHCSTLKCQETVLVYCFHPFHSNGEPHLLCSDVQNKC